MAGSGMVIIPWYATGFRANAFEEALGEIAAVAMRYGATSYAVYRSRDDTYRFHQLASFDDHLDWDRYWQGPEMIDFRIRHSSWYQIPVLYGWWDVSAGGTILTTPPESGNGRGDGAGVRDPESA
jgi:hypothetical protein